MTTEQKAKAYDEAWHKAKRIINVCVDDNTECRSMIACIQQIFPELKESEDERIRKAIHIYLDWLDGRNKDCQPKGEYTIRDMIAWLEKQGNPTDINPSEFDLHLNKLLKQFETLPKEELVSSLSFYLNVVQNDGTYKEEKESEQKLPIGKLPSEMKTIGESLGFTTQEECDKYNQMVTDLIMSDDGKSEQKPTDKEMKTLLRTEYEKGKADVIAEFQKAWSEEDEKNFARVDYACLKVYGGDSYSPDWLRKFLGIHKKWKPSDEQMKALHDLNLTGNISYAGQGQTLIKLYNDLNRLLKI